MLAVGDSITFSETSSAKTELRIRRIMIAILVIVGYRKGDASAVPSDSTDEISMEERSIIYSSWSLLCQQRRG